MEKSTDSTSSTASTNSSSSTGPGGSTTAGNNNNTVTTNCSDGNQDKQQKQQNATIKNTPTKNQVSNLIGCGPSSISSSSVTASSSANSLLLDKGATACGVVGNNLKSNANSNNKMSFDNTSTTTTTNITTLLGHQSSNKNNNGNNATTISNNAGSTASTAAIVPSTLPNLSASGSSSLATTSTSSSYTSISTTTASSQMAPISLNISTTTGGNFSVSVDPQITVENLKKIIAKKLKVAKDRICLLHREKELQDGLLKENNLMDGSKIILIPNVETGLLAQRPENTVMQALESLNDSQVNDFLSGKTPLNLSMRLGDHMMLIQLQLSTVNPVNGVAHNGSNCGSSSSRQRSSHHHHHHHRSNRTSSTGTQTSAGGSSSLPTANHSHHHHHHHHHHHGTTLVSNGPTTGTTVPAANIVGQQQQQQNITAVRKLELDTTCQTPRTISSRTTVNTTDSGAIMPATTSAAPTAFTKHSDLNAILSKRDFESLQNIVKNFAMSQPSARLQQQQQTTASASASAQMPSSSSVPSVGSKNVSVVAPTFHNPSEAVLLEQSPIKSLSNLVSSPIKTTAIKNIPNISNSSTGSNNSNSSSTTTATNNAAIETTHVQSSSAAICQDPIAAKLTSCLCTRLNGGLNTMTTMSHNSAKQCIETACISSQQQQQQQQQLIIQPHTTRTSTNSIMTSSDTPNCKATLAPAAIVNTISGSTISSSSPASRSSSTLHKIAYNPITRKHRHHHHHHHHHHHYHHSAAAVQQLNNMTTNQKMIVNTSTPIKTIGNDSGFNSSDDVSLNNSTAKIPAVTSPAAVVGTPLTTSTNSSKTATPVRNSTTASSGTAAITPIDLDDSGIVSDSRTLAEASRNLTQTLRKLSKEVFTNKIDFSASEETPRKSGSGAVIESMKNHGKGIYSGTFSGTLNPALQDRYGRPKRDISTVIHILNDLLSATPQYHRGARISFEAPTASASAAASIAAASGSTGTIHHSSRSKHLSSKHHQSSQPCVKCIKTHNSSSSTVNLQCASNANATGTSSSNVCTYGECNGHYVSSKSQSNKIYTCCQQDITTAAQHNLSTSTNTAGTTNTSNSHHHHHYAPTSTSSSSSHHHHHHHHQMADERRVCQCRYRIHSKTGERERDYTCPKCAAELDNIKTKSKLDQLRLVMQQRKQKREARKLKGAPYGARVVGTTTTATASGVTDSATTTLTASNSSIATPISVATSAATPSEVSPNHLVEEVDTAA